MLSINPQEFTPVKVSSNDELQLICQKYSPNIYDCIAMQIEEYLRIVQLKENASFLTIPEFLLQNNLDPGHGLQQYGNWFYYPWKNLLCHLLPEEPFLEVKTNRNQNKITREEQQTLKQSHVGIVGLSVGSAVALVLAQERLCGTLSLVDNDTVELSNTNRLQTKVYELGMSKALKAARSIMEMDPYMKVFAYEDRINSENVNIFFNEGTPIQIVFDECDDLIAKFIIREKAKSLRIPVLMDTSDRGLLDVERFDLDENLSLFHGLAENMSANDVAALDIQQRLLLSLQLLGGVQDLSPRMRQSLPLIGKSLCSYPQLASDISLGAASGAEAVRRILLGDQEVNGRYYIDFDTLLARPSIKKSSRESSKIERRDHQ